MTSHVSVNVAPVVPWLRRYQTSASEELAGCTTNRGLESIAGSGSAVPWLRAIPPAAAASAPAESTSALVAATRIALNMLAPRVVVNDGRGAGVAAPRDTTQLIDGQRTG